MKGLAIYAMVVYGLCVMGAVSNADLTSYLGLAMFTPVLIFAIIYLAKSNKKVYCGNCGAKQ